MISMAGFFETPEYRKYHEHITALTESRIKQRLGLKMANFTSAEAYVAESERLGAEISMLLYIRDMVPVDLTTGQNPGQVATEDMEEATYGEGKTELVGCEGEAQAIPTDG